MIGTGLTEFSLIRLRISGRLPNGINGRVFSFTMTLDPAQSSIKQV
jgi:hypothetical protein